MDSGLVDWVTNTTLSVLEQQSLMEFVTGTVERTNPVTILVEDRLRITAPHLILSPLCRPFATHVFRHSHTCPEGATSDELETVLVWRGLEVGDRVQMLRCSHGQTYYALAREGEYG